MLQHKKGFTLFEILLMVIIIWVWIMAIVVALNNGLSFIQKTRERTIAINLAREWIEAVYQIRDTNRKRRWWKKESCRLKIDPLQDDDTNCSNDTRMSNKYYFLTINTYSWQQYFSLSWWYTTWLDLSDGIDASDQNFALCQNTWDNSRYRCTSQFSTEWQFFRQIKWIWLFNKDSQTEWWSLLNCNTGEDSCGNNSAKEYRFCSQVQYIWKWRWTVELCWVLTNFQKK